jgi:hypothetical protein
MCRAATGWPPRRPGWPDVEPRPKHSGRLPAGVSSAAVRQPRDDRLLRRAGARLLQPGLLRRADADAPTRRSDVREIPAAGLQTAQLLWATVDSLWVHFADSDRYLDSVRAMRALEPEAVYSTHLPPAVGIAQSLCDMLAAAPDTDPFIGPDQARAGSDARDIPVGSWLNRERGVGHPTLSTRILRIRTISAQERQTSGADRLRVDSSPRKFGVPCRLDPPQRSG